MGYLGTPDDTNPKFTGRDRDPETADPTTPSSGLDWFNVRFLTSAQGRFQSPDQGNAGADPGNPQTWNGLAYVGNNPMSFTDPTGKCWWCDVLGIGLDVVGALFRGAVYWHWSGQSPWTPGGQGPFGLPVPLGSGLPCNFGGRVPLASPLTAQAGISSGDVALGRGVPVSACFSGL